MAERLKDQFFTAESVGALADQLGAAHPSFERDRFLADVFDGTWDGLELKDRMRHVARCMQRVLPVDYREALGILLEIAPHVHGFEAMSLPDFVEQFGQDDWEASLPALEVFTRYASSEFAIRPFLNADPARAMSWMHQWAESPHHGVRRLASEGCRPRLPWAMALPGFQADPGPILPILRKLRSDPSESVRRSVANNLNDITKDHPDLVLDLCEAWQGESREVDGVIKHACRTLLKAGNPRAMRLFGFGDPSHIEVARFELAGTKVALGDDLVFGFDLVVEGGEPSLVRLEYAIDFARANGRTSRKVFTWSEAKLEPGVHRRQRRYSIVDMSTRKHYPGPHRVTIIVNGVEKVSGSIEVTA